MKRFKLVVYMLTMAIASVVILSSCEPSASQVMRIERQAIKKYKAVSDSINAQPITVYCALVECYRNDTILSNEAAYSRDAINLQILVDAVKTNYAKYCPEDSLDVKYWELTVK